MFIFNLHVTLKPWIGLDIHDFIIYVYAVLGLGCLNAVHYRLFSLSVALSPYCLLSGKGSIVGPGKNAWVVKASAEVDQKD